MGQLLVDDKGASSFVDDNGRRCFTDDIGNFTYCTPSVATAYGLSALLTGKCQLAVSFVPQKIPTCSLSASPIRIKAGQSSTLTWSSSNASSISGIGFAPQLLSGSQSVRPTITTTYRITVTGLGGSTTASSTVTVRGR